jgi:hypothetical protein
MRNEVSREPWERDSGRRDELDLGVEMPVWGPVPEPYMMAMLRNSRAWSGSNLAARHSQFGIYWFRLQQAHLMEQTYPQHSTRRILAEW